MRMAVIEPRPIVCHPEPGLVRSAAPDDAAELLRLMHRLYSETEFLSRKPGEATLSVEGQRQRILDRTAAEREVFLVAVVGEQIVGSLGFDTRPLARFRHKGEFGIAVLRDFWGRGIGRALLSALCDWADLVGLVRLSLVVAADNVRAVRLYEHFGFAIEGRHRKDAKLSDGYHDAFTMARINDAGTG
jgi:RimJ/RimL family protein N-acetyltransferase